MDRGNNLMLPTLGQLHHSRRTDVALDQNYEIAVLDSATDRGE